MRSPDDPRLGDLPAEQSLDALLDEMDEAYLALDPAWRVVSINRRAAMFLQPG